MIIACILLAVILRAGQDKKYFWVLAWPGTVMHELLHYTVGFFLFARPTEISVVPERFENTTIGYVSFVNLNWFNSLPTAMAPLLALPIAWWATSVIPLEWSWAGLAWLWVISAMISQAVPSSVDFALGTQNKFGLIFWAAVIYLLFIRG